MASATQTLSDVASRIASFVNGSAANRWLVFLLLIVFTYVLARLFSAHVLSRLLRARRFEVAIAQLMSRLFVLAVFFASIFVYSRVVFHASAGGLAAGLATLGLVSLALGFGLQNTIANIAGGISLALDRPFRIGDQIMVRDVVGDVQEIGIRSTRILTRRKEFVVVPNKLLEEEFIWNYTMVYPDLRIDVPVTVSYDSDRELAEELMLGIAQAHPVVLRDPPPRVLARQFAAAGIELELRCWVAHPRNREVVLSDVLKSIKDRFEAEGVEIPFPYQVNVARSELPVPKRRRTGVHRTDGAKSVRRIFVPLCGSLPDPARVEYVVKLAKTLNAQVIAAYIADPGDRHAGEDSGRALHPLDQETATQGLWYKPLLIRSSDPKNAVVETAKSEDVDVVVLGVERARLALEWGRIHEGPPVRKADVEKELPDVTVHEAPGGSQLSLRTVEELQKSIQARRGRPAESALPPVQVSKPEPATSAVPSQPAEGPRQKPEEEKPERKE